MATLALMWRMGSGVKTEGREVHRAATVEIQKERWRGCGQQQGAVARRGLRGMEESLLTLSEARGLGAESLSEFLSVRWGNTMQEP